MPWLNAAAIQDAQDRGYTSSLLLYCIGHMQALHELKLKFSLSTEPFYALHWLVVILWHGTTHLY